MKTFFTNLSFRYKITLLVVAVSTLTISIGYTFAIFHDLNFLEDDFIDKAEAEAKLIGHYSISALSFHDEKGCKEVLKIATSELDIIAMELYDETGHLVTNIGDSKVKIPRNISTLEDEAVMIEEELRFIHRITNEGNFYGYLILHISTERLKETQYKDILGLTAVASLIIVFGGLFSFFAQRAVSSPLFKLVRFLNHAADDHNFSKSVPTNRKDEIGEIYQAVNKLLNTIRDHSKERDKYFSEIQKNNDKLANTLESFSDGFWEYDILKQTWFFSDRWIDTFGYERDHLSEENEYWERLIHPDDLTAYKKELENHLNGQTEFFHSEFRLLVKDGGYSWVFFKGKWVEKKEGKIIRMLGITDDINTLKKDKKQRDLNNEIELNNKKLSSISALSVGISHRLKNFLNPIFGYADFGLHIVGDDDLLKQELKLIKKSARDANKVVDNLLSFSGEAALIEKKIDIKEIIENIISDFQSINQNITFDFMSKLTKANIIGDRNKIKESVYHIVKNATESSYDNATIEIELSYIELNDSNEMLFKSVHYGEYVYLSIKDFGCGIEKQNLEYIFEPFYTTKDKTESVGLGLSIARGIILSHKGHLFITSDVEKGTTCKILLPVIA